MNEDPEKINSDIFECFEVKYLKYQVFHLFKDLDETEDKENCLLWIAVLTKYLLLK